MNKIRKFQLLLLAIVLCISCFFTCFAPTIQNVYASSVSVSGGYTSVLEDLQTDANFNADDYPVVADDYSLQVIDLAESNENELFVYVYQPSANYKNLVATSLFLSTDENGLTYKNYYLSLLNNHGAFYKYRVDNFGVSADFTRHYEITSIYRAFDETIDVNPNDDNGNMIDEMNFKVARHWVFTTTDNGISKSMQDIETITITSKFVGFVRYGDGDWWHMWGESACDRHFVAFTTDKDIDRLMEADIFYQYQNNGIYDPTGIGDTNYSFGDIKDGYAYLEYTQKGNYDNGHYNYVWDRIQTPTDFFATVNVENVYQSAIFDVKNESKITNEGKLNIENKEWVLSFLETGVETTKSFEWHNTHYTRVSNVSILRLKFETDGIIYNLGVIDNKQTGSENPVNTYKTTLDLNDTFKIILAILLLIVLLIVLAPILPTIFSILFAIIKILLKVVCWLITAPFKLISKVFKK